VSEPVTVLQHLEAALQRACSFDRNARVPPAALLWADKSFEWRPVVARLAAGLPIVTLGQYDGDRTGPAIWIRCVVDRTIGETPEEEVPIVYVPGFDRSDLRAVEGCPAELQAIAELQYRGVFFGSRAGRDWTTTAFFSNRDEGLGIEIGRDAVTEAAFARALHILLDEPVVSLREKSPLRAADLGALLEPDPVKTLLGWLDDPSMIEALDEANREEFARVAKQDYGFDPDDDGPIKAAELLGARAGTWRTVWDRFADNPARYPGVVERLRQGRPADVLIVDHPGSWPQDNEHAESDLRSALSKLADQPDDAVRAAIGRLEAEHCERREWVWAALGQAPLPAALEHLAFIAKETEGSLSGETPLEIAEAYASGGWSVDDRVLLAIASVDTAPDREAVQAVAAALYRPWADRCARRFQEAVRAHGAAEFGGDSESPAAGECMLFTDGLRFDLGVRVSERLKEQGLDVELTWQLAALPSLTATAKPAVSPAASRLAAGEGFGTTVAETGQAVTAEVLRKVVAAVGITVIADNAVAEPGTSGWTEFGNVDEIGHSHEDRFPHAVDAQVTDIADRVLGLLDAGWASVIVVTDHGWLYVPGGLDKVSLPEHLTVTRKGRAARLRDDAGEVDHPVVPWRWDSSVRVAVAPGLSCYVAGRVYEHGGLSPQECVTPVLTVKPRGSSATTSIDEIMWAGMRVRVAVAEAPAGSRIDVRTKAAAATASKLDAPVEISEGSASALVVDPDASGEAAFVVVLGSDGSLLAQRSTTIGGDE
jgi:hypothetical protein